VQVTRNHLIIVGTEAPRGSDHEAPWAECPNCPGPSAMWIAGRVGRLITKSTKERFSEKVIQGDNVVIIVSENIGKSEDARHMMKL
jgi:hypothetical protein